MPGWLSDSRDALPCILAYQWIRLPSAVAPAPYGAPVTVRPAPTTIFNDLMHLVDDALKSNRPMTQFELKKLEQQAAQLSNVDPSGALEIRGYLAAINGDIAGVEEYFGRALKVSDDFSGTVVRYILLLSKLGQSSRTLQVFSDYKSALDGNPEATRRVAEALGFSGWIFTARELVDALDTSMGLPLSGEGRRCSVNMESFTEEDIATAVGFSIRYLKSIGARVVGARSAILANRDGTGALLIELLLDDDATRVSELEWDYFAALGREEFQAESSGVVSFSLASKIAASDANHRI